MTHEEDVRRVQAETEPPTRLTIHIGPIIIALVCSIPFWLAVIFGK